MGCGSSLSKVSSTEKNKSLSSSKKAGATKNKAGQLPPIGSRKKLAQKKGKRSENLESFTLVCLDKQFNDNDKQLRSIIDYISCFNRIEPCEEFLLELDQRHSIFLIISTEHFVEIISHVHDLAQIVGVYVTQQNRSHKDNIDKQWMKRYSKLKGVYSDRPMLLEQLASDVQILMHICDLTPLTVYSRLDALQSTMSSVEHLRFLFYQMFIHEFCLDSSSSSLNYNEFLQLIDGYYSSNEHDMLVVREFRDEYRSSERPFSWFTRPCFVRRILTRSLLALDIPTLLAMRFFIKDMFKAMISQTSASNGKPYSYSNGSNRYLNGRSSGEQLVYHGQALAKETFLKIKLNIGEIMSMNNFLLASRNRQDPLKLLREHIPSTELVYRVLFEIKIPSDYSLQKQRPFVDLSSLNYSNKSVDENLETFSVLFFIGSIFRINTTVFDVNNNCWIVQLTLYDEGSNQDFAQLFTFLGDTRRSNPEKTTVLANLLRQISPNSAEQLYEYFLRENSGSLNKLECYRGLGLCSYSRDDFDQALSYFEKALHLRPTDEQTRSSLHNSIGLVYARQAQSDDALTHFSKALEISSLPLHLACVHHNLALVYSEKEHHEKELDHYEEALQIRSRQYPGHHLQVASLHNNIGIAYADLQQYDQALSNLRKGLEMRLKLLSDSHLDVARSYANIGTVYAKTKELRMALEYFNKAQVLFEKQGQTPQEDMDQLQGNLKIINDKLRRKTY